MSQVNTIGRSTQAAPTSRTAQRSQIGRYNNRRFALLLMAPALFFYTVFLIVPLLGTVVIGFTDWTGSVLQS